MSDLPTPVYPVDRPGSDDDGYHYIKLGRACEALGMVMENRKGHRTATSVIGDTGATIVVPLDDEPAFLVLEIDGCGYMNVLRLIGDALATTPNSDNNRNPGDDE